MEAQVCSPGKIFDLGEAQLFGCEEQESIKNKLEALGYVSSSSSLTPERGIKGNWILSPSHLSQGTGETERGQPWPLTGRGAPGVAVLSPTLDSLVLYFPNPNSAGCTAPQ